MLENVTTKGPPYILISDIYKIIGLLIFRN